jgi:1,5-anhydro-D-fructose reductase (1,5-anhydro-D-mannitol-forming)
VTLYGSHGRITGLGTLWEARQGKLEVVSETVNSSTEFSPDLLANYVGELQDFHRAIATQRQPAASGLDGLRVVQVTLAMIASAREGRTVKIEPLTV